MTPKEEFIALYQAHITRPGADKRWPFWKKVIFSLLPLRPVSILPAAEGCWSTASTSED